MINPTTSPNINLDADPAHVFLRSKEVFVRYTWGRSKGYEMLQSPGFPRPIGGRYRLDALIAWEERILAGDLDPKPQSVAVAPVTLQAPNEQLSDELPVRRRTRGLNRKQAA